MCAGLLLALNTVSKNERTEFYFQKCEKKSLDIESLDKESVEQPKFSVDKFNEIFNLNLELDNFNFNQNAVNCIVNAINSSKDKITVDKFNEILKECSDTKFTFKDKDKDAVKEIVTSIKNFASIFIGAWGSEST